MMLCRAQARRAGFTLIEIMIVIAIIAILAAIAIPNIREARAEANYQSCLKNCAAIGEAITMALIRKGDQGFYSAIGGRCWGYSYYLTDTFTDGDGCMSSEGYLVLEGYLSKPLVCPIDTNGRGYVFGVIFEVAPIPRWIVGCNSLGDHIVAGKACFPMWADGLGVGNGYEEPFLSCY